GSRAEPIRGYLPYARSRRVVRFLQSIAGRRAGRAVARGHRGATWDDRKRRFTGLSSISAKLSIVIARGNCSYRRDSRRYRKRVALSDCCGPGVDMKYTKARHEFHVLSLIWLIPITLNFEIRVSKRSQSRRKTDRLAPETSYCKFVKFVSEP